MAIFSKFLVMGAALPNVPNAWGLKLRSNTPDSSDMLTVKAEVFGTALEPEMVFKYNAESQTLKLASVNFGDSWGEQKVEDPTQQNLYFDVDGDGAADILLKKYGSIWNVYVPTADRTWEAAGVVMPAQQKKEWLKMRKAQSSDMQKTTEKTTATDKTGGLTNVDKTGDSLNTGKTTDPISNKTGSGVKDSETSVNNEGTWKEYTNEWSPEHVGYYNENGELQLIETRGEKRQFYVAEIVSDGATTTLDGVTMYEFTDVDDNKKFTLLEVHQNGQTLYEVMDSDKLTRWKEVNWDTAPNESLSSTVERKALCGFATRASEKNKNQKYFRTLSTNEQKKLENKMNRDNHEVMQAASQDFEEVFDMHEGGEINTPSEIVLLIFVVAVVVGLLFGLWKACQPHEDVAQALQTEHSEALQL